MNLYSILTFLAETTPTATEAPAPATGDGLTMLEQFLDRCVNWLSTVGIRIVIAIILMFIGFKIVNTFSRKLANKLSKKNADVTISKVLVSSLKISLKAIIILFLVGYVGIQTASLSAVIASLGVGISLAVQGTLSNFAGGIIIIIMRPFKIGDFITSNGQAGTVEDIKLFYTHVVTPDNKMIYIPNGTLANNVIVNNSVKETRRVDVTMSVAYDTDIALAKNLINKVFEANTLILKEPAPFVDVNNYGSSSIDLVCRAWCQNSDYWTVYFYLMNQIKAEFDNAGIEIPFDQLDVNLKK